MSKLFFQSHRVQQVAPTVSPVGSVGASALRAEVSTGDPHPLQGRQKVNLISLDEARFSNFIDSLKAAKYTNYVYLAAFLNVMAINFTNTNC